MLAAFYVVQPSPRLSLNGSQKKPFFFVVKTSTVKNDVIAFRNGLQPLTKHLTNELDCELLKTFEVKFINADEKNRFFLFVKRRNY